MKTTKASATKCKQMLPNASKCFDERTKINSVSLQLCCAKIAKNYRQTKEQLNALLSQSKGSAQITLQGDIIINTIDNKRLASEIVKEVKHYFGELQNKPHNTNDETLILTEAEEWQNDIQQTQYTPKQYAEFVDERFKRDYNLEQLPQEVKEQLAKWVSTKSEQPDTLNEVQENNSYTLNDKTKAALKSLLKNQKGKQAALIVYAAVNDGYMSKPVFNTLKKEYEVTGTKQAYNNYYKNLNESPQFYKSDIEAAKEALKKAIENL